MRIFPSLLLALLPTALLPTALLAAPTQVWSARIAATGLGQTEATLAALPTPTPDDLFALGGIRFLMGIEQALQLRWQVGATGELAPLPILRLQLPPNPAPQPMRASLLAEIFTGITAQMTFADAALAAVPQGADLALTIRLPDLWFDINANATRDPAEDLLPLALDSFTMPFADPAAPAATTIRFDTADLHWLRAYTHLLSATGSLVLAFDPTAATQKVLTAAADKRARFGSLSPSTLDQFNTDAWLDKAAIAILALRQQPDPVLTRQTAAHLKQMIALNIRFWQAVGQETDNDAEWIPNPRQTAALGFILPDGADLLWQGILSDLDQLLAGRVLFPHISFPPESGINIAKWLENPNPLDLVGWIHGMDALPYAETGPIISNQAAVGFEQLLEGRGLLFAFLLN